MSDHGSIGIRHWHRILELTVFSHILPQSEENKGRNQSPAAGGKVGRVTRKALDSRGEDSACGQEPPEGMKQRMAIHLGNLVSYL